MPPALLARPLALAGTFAVIGVALGAVPPGVQAMFLLSLFACAVLMWLVGRRRAPGWLLCAACAAGLFAGIRGEEAVRRRLSSVPDSEDLARIPVGQVALIVHDCREDPFQGRSSLVGESSDGRGFRCHWPGQIPEGLGPGARVLVRGRFRAPRTARNPGELDGERWLALEGASCIADLRESANLEVLAAAPEGFAVALGRLRRDATRRLRAALPHESAALAAALLLGVRSGLAAEQRSLFERTGTMHLLAISGMHLVLLAGIIHRLLIRCGAGPRSAALVTLALVIAYVPVAGNGPPVRRAATGLACYAVALLRGRPPDPASALGGAALLIALFDPADVFRVGFRLSFAACIGIAWLAPRWQERWGRRHRLLGRFPAVREDRPLRQFFGGYLLKALPVGLAAWLATLMPVAHAFGIVTPFAPLTNLLAAPLLALALPLAALIASGATVLAPLFTATMVALEGALALAAHLPGSPWPTPPVATISILLWSAGLAALPFRAKWALLPLAAAALLPLGPSASTADELLLLDVGHGQAALVRMRGGATALIDGGSKGRPDAARTLLLPALRALHVRRLDLVVLTHADADHWNALPGLLRSFPVGRLVAGADPPLEVVRAARRAQIPLERARTDEILLESGDSRLRVLLADDAEDAAAWGRNDRSLALVLECQGQARILLPADREEAGLRALLRRGLPRCDVLVAPHHGAACRVAEALGFATRPRLLLVSCSPEFPDGTSLRAYARAGPARVFTTAQFGCITVRFGPDVHDPPQVTGHLAPIMPRAPSRDRATIRPP